MGMMNASATLEQLVADSDWLHRLALALVRDEATADDLDVPVDVADAPARHGRDARAITQGWRPCIGYLRLSPRVIAFFTDGSVPRGLVL
jgi:hypothetical protein